MSVQPKEAGVGGGESREVIVTKQAKEMLKKLPPIYDPFEVKQRLVKRYFKKAIIFTKKIKKYIDCRY